MENTADLMLKLSAAFGPSGNEEEIRRIFRGSCPQLDWRKQGIGNLYAELSGIVDGPRIMLAAHMDEVGVMVQSLTEQGWGRFVTLGSWPPAALPAQRFRFRNRNGVDYWGVTGVLPPHFSREEDRNKALKPEDLHLDFGTLNRDGLAELGIEIGDMGVPDVEPRPLPTGVLMGKALDDRVGCAALLRLMADPGNHPNTLVAVGTVQEEVGLRGMKVAGRQLRPDIAFVLEGAPTDERIGGAAQTIMGNGPQIRLYDPSLIAHRGLIRWLTQLAQAENIPFQIAVRVSGGTDGGAVHLEGEGIPTAVIGIPVRYAHSHQGCMALSDLEKTVRLLRAAVNRLDRETLAEIMNYTE